jgi:hypothetical protein
MSSVSYSGWSPPAGVVAFIAACSIPINAGGFSEVPRGETRGDLSGGSAICCGPHQTFFSHSPRSR